MKFQLRKLLFTGLLAVTTFGCDSRPVVVTPDADDDTTIIQDRDVETERDDASVPPPQSGADVKVDVGGDRGIQVDVDRDANGDSSTNP